MMSRNTPTELILTLHKKEHQKCKEFLESLKLSSENAEILEHWFSEGAWNIETDENERLLIFFGKEKIHVVLKKNDQFEQLKNKCFKFLSF